MRPWILAKRVEFPLKWAHGRKYVISAHKKGDMVKMGKFRGRIEKNDLISPRKGR